MLETWEVEADDVDGNCSFNKTVLQHTQYVIRWIVWKSCFAGRVILRFGYIARSAISPNLYVPCHFLWGQLTVKLCTNKPGTPEELKENIRTTDKDLLHMAMFNFHSRLQEYFVCKRCHIGNVIFKKWRAYTKWHFTLETYSFLYFLYSNRFIKTAHWKSSHSVAALWIVTLLVWANTQSKPLVYLDFELDAFLRSSMNC
jgi:hypothetical protein